MNKSCLIICESIYNNNTLKLARVISHTLGCRFVTAQEAEAMDLSAFEVIGFGSGIYFGQHHPRLFDLIEQMPPNQQSVFIFSSRGNPFLGKYHLPIKNVLLKKNKNIIGEFSVTGYDETGPWVIIGGGHRGKPDEKDLKKAVRFVNKILPQYCMPDFYLQLNNKKKIQEGRINAYLAWDNGSTVFLNGDRVTFNHNNCNGCGQCAKVCPLNIIELSNNKAICRKELDCTLCKLCVINCKQRAITLHYSWLDAINVARRHGKKIALL